MRRRRSAAFLRFGGLGRERAFCACRRGWRLSAGLGACRRFPALDSGSFAPVGAFLRLTAGLFCACRRNSFALDSAPSGTRDTSLGRVKSNGFRFMEVRSLKTPHRGVFLTLPPNRPVPQKRDRSLRSLRCAGILVHAKNLQSKRLEILLVDEDGFGPSKLKSNRFTVCPLWPLGNSPIWSW